jgi:hypothetical protein
MEYERMQVLEMVAGGTITPQQGAELLDALAAAPVRTTGVGEEPGRERRSRRTRFSTDDLVQLSDHGVEPSFIRAIDAAGPGPLSVDQLIQLYEHGVAPAFMRELYNLGFSQLSTDDAIQLAEHAVDAAFIREIADLGLSDLRPDQIIELREHGVDHEFLRALGGASAVEERDHRG